jgi:hypothetical protein
MAALNDSEEVEVLPPLPTDEPGCLAQQAATLLDTDLPQAFTLLQEAAQGWLRRGGLLLYRHKQETTKVCQVLRSTRQYLK